VSAQLELTDGARARIRELQALSERAEEGDQDARRELRRALKESAPEVIARCSDIARRYRWVVADTASGHNPLQQEAIVERAERLAAEIAGETPTPLEALLAERIASLWVLSEVQEALLFAWYRRGGDEHKRLAPSYLLQMCRIQESVNRRYLAAIRMLAQVRKLQASTPTVQYNTQINLSPRPQDGP
jgi:hypothetical protein